MGDAAYHRDPLEWGIGDAFLGAQLLAVALADGLAGDAARLDGALGAYRSGFRDRTMPIFELKAASLKDPASAVPIYRKVAQSREETTRCMDVLAGNIPFKAFLNPASLARLLA